MTGRHMRSYKIAATLICGALIPLLTGCQTTGTSTANIPAARQIKVVEVDPIGDALVAAAEESSRALDKLSLVQQARTPPAEVKPLHIPSEMDREIIFDWHGEIEPALRALTREIGYDFEVAGRKGAVPVIVHVSGERPRSIYAILRDLGTQAGRWATVAVNPDASIKRVELRYEGL